MISSAVSVLHLRVCGWILVCFLVFSYANPEVDLMAVVPSY